MSASQSKVTPQAAPRDIDGLMKLGIFQLRLLLEGMGRLSTDQEKMAFAKMSTPEKVNEALRVLHEWDKVNGGAVHQNGVTPGVPMMPAPNGMAPMPNMMPPQGMPVTQVDPASVAAAAQAVAPPPPPPTTSGRKPRTSENTAAPTPDLGGEVLKMLSRILEQNDETNSTLAAGFKELTTSVAEVSKANHQHAENYKLVYGALQSISGSMGALAQQTQLCMALVLPLAEQYLGGGREDIIKMAVSDLPSIQQLLQAAVASQGKG